MTTLPRPNLSTSPTPVMIFPNISGAELYNFVMTKPDGTELWTKSLPTSAFMDTEDGYYKCDYPYPEFPLERIGTYSITGETNDKKSDFRGEAEVVLLDESTIENILTLESEIDLDSQPPSQLAEKYLKAITNVLVFKPDTFLRPTREWGRGCKFIPMEAI